MGITIPRRFSIIINNVRQKNVEDRKITLTRSKFDATRLYISIAPTIVTATAANIKGKSDLSNCVRKNVSLALELVMLDPMMQKNISIRMNVGLRSSGFIWIIVIYSNEEITYTGSII